ncbi:hypothetical protein [Pseudogemmobacter bohemicus]|uniref:hypothetical protein n=1 Tax=Pseudogemmobacter bohemicus TaxID=2250708 RepID=UPI000DD2E7A0|nr:hypothetical protein [Pseudogemmobacter bohemicus]
MALQVIKLDFAAYEPKLTPEAQAAFDKWRALYDDMAHHCRQASCWTWAGELTYRVNGVKRMCRTVPQPVSEEHMRVILSSVEQFYSLPVAGEENPRNPVVALMA